PLATPSFLPTRRSSDLEFLHGRIAANGIQIGVNVGLKEIAEAAVVGDLQALDRLLAVFVLRSLVHGRERGRLAVVLDGVDRQGVDRKSTRLNSSHQIIS